MHTLEESTIQLIGANGERRTATIRGSCVWDSSGPNCSLTLTSDALEVTGSGGDYFEAFCRIRETLETLSLMPHCYGASRSVYPSGMCRDMGLGRRAYKLTIG